MHSKKGFELSLNMIIMVVLALVFMGIAIAFIKAAMPKPINSPDVCDFYPPTEDSPVCVQEDLDLSRGKEYKLTVSFFNKEDDDITSASAPSIGCDELELAISSLGQSLPMGETADYMMNIKVPKDAEKGTYICTLSLSITQKQISIAVS